MTRSPSSIRIRCRFIRPEVYPSVSWPLSSRTRNMRLRRASTISPSISIFASFSAKEASYLITRRKTRGRSRPRVAVGRSGDRGDVRRLGALRALARLVLHARSFGERLEALAENVAVMDERGPSSPPSGVMNPYPFASLNHFTVPCAMENTSLTHSRTRKEGAVAQTGLALCHSTVAAARRSAAARRRVRPGPSWRRPTTARVPRASSRAGIDVDAAPHHDRQRQPVAVEIDVEAGETAAVLAGGRVETDVQRAAHAPPIGRRVRPAPSLARGSGTNPSALFR